MGLLDRFTRRGWASIADATPDVAREERVFVPVSQPTVPSDITLQSQWREAPVRGSLELLAAYVHSPPFRAVVSRIANSFGDVEYYERTPVRVPNNPMHPLCQLINNYNPKLIGAHGRMLELLYLDVLGESITIKIPVSGPKKYNLDPVPPTWVQIAHDDKLGTQYLIQIPGRGEYRFTPDQIVHRRDLNLLNPYGRGGGAGLSVADEIESAEYASKWAKGYFLNGTKPEYIMSVMGATEPQAAQIKQSIREKHQGFEKAWTPFITSADVKIHELTRKIGDERIVELQKNWQNIIRWVYGVPPEVIGDVDNSNRATAQEAEQLMGKFVTGPRARDYKDSMMAHFSEDFGGVLLGYDHPAPRSFDRADEIKSRHSWCFTRNEVRESAGMDAVPDGDVYAVPANLVEVKQGRTVLRIVGNNDG